MSALYEDKRELEYLETISELEAENAKLCDVLTRFREFVITRATQWDTTFGPCNHHNPIWGEMAEALAAKSAPADHNI